jgi:cardiolipin synthase
MSQPPDESTLLTPQQAGVNIEPGPQDDGWISPPPVELEDGSRVHLYKDGEALRAALQAIERARSRICLEVYIFSDDPTGQAFSDALCRKSREGVKVFVLYDSVGSLATPRAFFDRMRDAGIQVEQFHPIRPWETRFGWRPFNRDHRKLLVIDYEVAWMGGLNIGREYSGSWVGSPDRPVSEFWRDNAIKVVGPGARAFLRAFARSWNYVLNGGRMKKAEYTCGLDDELVRVAFAANAEGRFLSGRRQQKRQGLGNVLHADLCVLASVPCLSSPLRVLLHRLITSARREIELTMAYFAPDDGLVQALCDAAGRGTRVRLMLPSRSDVKALLVAQRAFYETLMAAGVEVYERNAIVLHAKTLVIDRNVSVVGSTNLDYRSIEYNLELSAIIRSAEFGQQVHDLFEHDVRFATRIMHDQWRRRPQRDRVVQWVVKKARYLL